MRERSKSRDFMKCVACWCNNCKMMRAKLQGDTVVNLVQEDIIVNLCDTFVVNKTHRGDKVMILDPWAHVSLAEKPCLDQYLKEFDLMIKDMVSSSCYKVFQFGGKITKYESKILISLLLVVWHMDGKDDLLDVQVYVIDTDVPFLCGNIYTFNPMWLHIKSIMYKLGLVMGYWWASASFTFSNIIFLSWNITKNIFVISTCFNTSLLYISQ